MTEQQRATLRDVVIRNTKQINAGWPWSYYPGRAVHILETCAECGGAGERTFERFGMAYRYACGSCGGQGVVPREATV